MLHEYIGKVSNQIHLADSIVKDSKKEQKDILREINKLKHELEEVND